MRPATPPRDTRLRSFSPSRIGPIWAPICTSQYVGALRAAARRACETLVGLSATGLSPATLTGAVSRLRRSTS
jgi:hypothetical protein